MIAVITVKIHPIEIPYFVVQPNDSRGFVELAQNVPFEKDLHKETD